MPGAAKLSGMNHALRCVLVLLCCAACKPSVSGPETPKVVALSHDDLRARASIHMETIDFIKPRSDSTSMDPYQAPILYRESGTGGLQLGALESLELRDGNAQIRTDQPTIYHHEYERDGRIVRSFLWFVEGKVANSVDLQGLRIWLDTSGDPWLYEVLADRSGQRQFYVSRSVEEELGLEALPGRVHAAESNDPEGVNALVVGLVTQGQEPLGPIVYWDRSSGDVLNLHCRCTSSAITNIERTIEYELKPWSSTSEELRAILLANLPGGWVTEEGLAIPGFEEPSVARSRLRLPAGR